MQAEGTLLPETIEDTRTATSSWRGWLEARARAIESQPWIIIAALSILYVIFIWYRATVILWHDELFTYYIAKSTSFNQLITYIRLLDLNPPLGYVLTGITQRLFGDSAVATRLPAILSFFVASMACLYFLARRIGLLWATFSILLVWYSPCLYFATQARPYALVIAFFSITLVSWDAAIRSTSNRNVALAGIVVGNVGMMLSHVFAIFSIGPFILAEMVRWYQTRRADWALWTCMLLPLSLVASYIPLMNRFQAEAFPLQFQGGPKKIVVFFYKWVFLNICPGLLAALIAALATMATSPKADSKARGFAAAHTGLFIGFLLPPVLINMMLMRTHGAFWERYCLTSAVAVYIATGSFVAYKLAAGRFAALVASLVLIAISLSNYIVTPYMDKQARARVLHAINFDTFHEDLPMVAASGVTFVEMDHNESSRFDKRFYYLTNRAAALQYGHATIFEGLAVEKNYFPFRGHVDSYSDFIQNHRHFLVIGTLLDQEDWLLRKLQDDGAQLTILGDYLTPYKDNSIYDVKISTPQK